MVRTCQFGRKNLLSVMIVEVRFDLHQAALRLSDGQLAGFCDTPFLTGLHHDPVHNDFNVMLIGLLQFDLVLAKDLHLAIDSDSGETLTLDAIQHLLMGALLTAHHRCQHQKFGALIQGHDGIYHLVHGLR